jgi:hypothetical protein
MSKEKTAQGGHQTPETEAMPIHQIETLLSG